jgi:hypothetical protein
MFDTATVTTRPPACGVADILPAESIKDMIQPPKISPFGLLSAGIAKVREASSPFGSVELRCLSFERIAPSPEGYGRPASYVALQHRYVNSFEIRRYFDIALHNK